MNAPALLPPDSILRTACWPSRPDTRRHRRSRRRGGQSLAGLMGQGSTGESRRVSQAPSGSGKTAFAAFCQTLEDGWPRLFLHGLLGAQSAPQRSKTENCLERCSRSTLREFCVANEQRNGRDEVAQEAMRNLEALPCFQRATRLIERHNTCTCS